MRLIKNDHEIRSVEDWYSFAPPKQNYQWVPGRSAFELARSWCGSGMPAVPQGIARLLEACQPTASLQVDCAWPEHRIHFDDQGGEPRNADVAFVGVNTSGKVAITIEAKADEPFGDTVAEVVNASLERLISNPKSRGLHRVAGLVQSLFAARVDGAPAVSELRYQLLTAAAGSLAFARSAGASTAVLIVHEFVTNGTREQRHRRNAEALSLFLRRLGGAEDVAPAMPGLSGPYTVPGRPLFDRAVPLLVGKVVSDLRGLGAYTRCPRRPPVRS